MFSYNNSRIRQLYYHAPDLVRNVMTTVYSFRQKSLRFGREYNNFLNLLENEKDNTSDLTITNQTKRLKQLLVLAQDTVPYYKKIFQEYEFEPRSLKSLSDLSRLPILEKEIIQNNSRDLRNQKFKGSLLKTHTSGTTGRGLHLVISQSAYQKSNACYWFAYRLENIYRGDAIATIAGHPVIHPKKETPPFWQYDSIENELFFSSYHIHDNTLPDYLEKLDSFQPTMIRGYPSSIYLIALAIIKEGIFSIHPKAVFTSSETLFDYQRNVIERAFGCPVYSHYGNTERVAHILQCETGNYHIVSQACVVEVINSDGSPASNGDPGELICTGLLDDAMPLIRYRIGDTGILSSKLCTCGRNTPILSSIEGRVDDYIVTPEGRYVGRVDHAFKDMVHVKEAQVIQETQESILVKIVPDCFSSEDENHILQELRLRLGSKIKIRFEIVEKITRLPNGKFRFVISKVPAAINKEFQN